jgi:hypothetical protein
MNLVAKQRLIKAKDNVQYAPVTRYSTFTHQLVIAWYNEANYVAKQLRASISWIQTAQPNSKLKMQKKSTLKRTFGTEQVLYHDTARKGLFNPNDQSKDIMFFCNNDKSWNNINYIK